VVIKAFKRDEEIHDSRPDLGPASYSRRGDLPSSIGLLLVHLPSHAKGKPVVPLPSLIFHRSLFGERKGEGVSHDSQRRPRDEVLLPKDLVSVRDFSQR
jgi:hypothetical protein